ncbi:MAG TPA: ATP-binding protein [Baekduia sp.]|nr:ATP-binding protein [Baekduia sp.]
MSAETLTMPGAPRRAVGSTRVVIALVGCVLLIAPAIALLDRGLWPWALVLALAGSGAATVLLTIWTVRSARRQAMWAALFVVVVASLIVIRAAVSLFLGANGAGFGQRLSDLTFVPGSTLILLTLPILGAVAGVVLIADGLRPPPGDDPSAWRQMTDARTRGKRLSWRIVVGALLIGWTALAMIFVGARYVANNPALIPLVLIAVALAVCVVVGTPLLVAGLARTERQNAATAWEDERQRFAAHLHDSVLQTLALIQRQASEPAVVARLARRQEHALRAWMAGETELFGGTLAAALREVVAGVEDDAEISVELSIIGDRALAADGEALVAAVREALRNAARHAPGAAVFVFAELSAERAEVFVRDDGPGFDPDSVPAERRGVRDAIVGRMAAAGGEARIDAAPGQGAEVMLILNGRESR